MNSSRTDVDVTALARGLHPRAFGRKRVQAVTISKSPESVTARAYRRGRVPIGPEVVARFDPTDPDGEATAALAAVRLLAQELTA